MISRGHIFHLSLKKNIVLFLRRIVCMVYSVTLWNALATESEGKKTGRKTEGDYHFSCIMINMSRKKLQLDHSGSTVLQCIPESIPSPATMHKVASTAIDFSETVVNKSFITESPI